MVDLSREKGGCVGLTVTIRELTSAAEIRAAAPAWEALLARSASNRFFLTPLFQSLWWERLGVGRPRVLIGHDDGRGTPRFIVPLYRCAVEGLGTVVRLIGGSEVSDYLDAVAAAADLDLAWRAAFDLLAAAPGTWDALELLALPEDSPSRRIVARLAAERGWSAEESIDDVCPVVALAPTWAGYLAGLRKKDRHELRRKIGRLEREAGRERFASVGPDDDIERAIGDFMLLHRQSGQEKDGFWTPALEGFFRDLIRATHQAGQLRLFFQFVDERPAATVLAFRYDDRYYVYNSGFDPALRDLSVGVVCMGRAIQAAIAEGVALFDLLQGDEAYKYDLGATNTTVYRCLVRPGA
jgi:CelD/BcsL family acetyltransferase involved in cellulose biosynthesis